MIGVELEPQLNIITTRLSLPEALRESVHAERQGRHADLQVPGGIDRAAHVAEDRSTGPIGIAQLSGEAAREGPSAFFGLMAMVSLNLAIFNLLPIPILDGGVILMLLVEMLMRRDLSLQVKEDGVQGRFRLPDDGGGVRDLQRHLSKILPPARSYLKSTGWKACSTAISESFDPRLTSGNLSFPWNVPVSARPNCRHSAALRGSGLSSRPSPGLLSLLPRTILNLTPAAARAGRFLSPERRAALVARSPRQNPARSVARPAGATGHRGGGDGPAGGPVFRAGLHHL